MSNYFDIPCISATEIKAALKSEKHWRHYKSGAKEQSDSFTVGTLVHLGVLEEDKFFALPKWAGRRAGKSWDDFVERNGDLYITNSQLDDVLPMIKSANYCLQANGVDKSKSQVESVFVGSGRKAKVDIYCEGKIVELKTTSDCSPEAFSRDAFKYGYLTQLAWYSIVVSKFEKVNDFGFCVISSKKPHDSAYYVVPKEMIELEVERCLQAEEKIKHWATYENTNPVGQYPNASTLLIPAWAIPQEDELTFGGESIF